MLTQLGKPSSVILLSVLLASLLLATAWVSPNPTQSSALNPQHFVAQPVTQTEELPPGARVETVIEQMNNPVAMAFDPQGRLFYTEKGGAVRLFANGRLQEEPVIRFNVNSNFERGLLGIAIDPSVTQNRYIYVYYTCADNSECGGENRVVRFVERDGRGSNPQVIFTSPQTAGNHVGGNIHFGPDGKLYVTVGDSARAERAQDLTVKNGKLHRINPDGSNPPDNPRFQGAPTNALGSIYAIGLRNSFDFTFDPLVQGRIFASENGPGCDDEMNRIEAGFNYGWRDSSICEGGNPDPRFNTIRPLWYAPASDCCLAPTGIEVYRGDRIPQWRNELFMANYQNRQLYHFYLNPERTVITGVRVVNGVRAGMDLVTGPDGALYYMDGGGYANGQLKRIVGPGGGQPQPTATPQPGNQPPTAIPGSGSRTFPETGKTVTGIFLDYWQRNGGLPQQGFPISGVITETSDLDGKQYTVQYFERAVFEYHPQNQPPFNVLLSQLGTFQYKKSYPNGAPNQRPNSSAGSVLFPETGKRLGGRFLAYWRQNGGLMQQGYPISDEFVEKSDLNGKEYLVQYFERAVFELHPENRPPYDVLLSQLGTFRYREKYGNR